MSYVKCEEIYYARVDPRSENGLAFEDLSGWDVEQYPPHPRWDALAVILHT